MSRWNNAMVLVLLIYLESCRSIELSVEKVECDLKEVYPLEVLSCEHRSQQPDKSEKEVQSTVAVGVQCAFKEYNSTVSVIKECNKNGWHDTDIYNAAHRDRTSPSISCPYVEPKLADQIQTNRIMNWKEPLAHDNKDGTITPQRGGPGPGVLFNEGSTYVKYYARDRAGNHNTCIVKVTVKVVRCPAVSPIRNGYYVCHPSDDLVQGTSCYFGCYRGHKLSGHQTIECIGTIDKSHGHWNNPQPICEKLQCPVLPPAIKSMHMTCTDRNYYRSTCRFSCDPGYDITPGQTRVMLCTENGSWRGAVPTCKDSEPPKFTKCLGYQVGYTERGSDDGHIPTFQSPEVTDNIAKNIQPVLTSKTNPNSRMRRGVYMISYDAVDTAGNKASGCKIKLVIKTNSAIFGLTLSHEIYDVAISILMERFGNVQSVVNKHFSDLINLQSASNQTTNLRRLYDDLERHLRSLEALQQDVTQDVFISMITSKLPKEVIIQLEIQKGNNERWTVGMLRQFFNTYITAREAAESQSKETHTGSSSEEKQHSKYQSNGNNFQPRKHLSAEALMTIKPFGKNSGSGNSMVCRYCDGHHRSDECRKLSTIVDRKQKIKGSCYTCLKPGHVSRDCRFETAC
ncbi:unnamed protein product [Mytilus coruscus]|uniref:CSMD n=1 Tax=Mytilus coruscus TaxID=42192 RepID=A0A6J7ZTW0_MYTCO|nr:unnamed protein product [Mytilus coruscus]